MGNGSSNRKTGAAGGGAIYALGIFGAWVFFWQQADNFWAYVLVLFRACSGRRGWSTRSSTHSSAD